LKFRGMEKNKGAFWNGKSRGTRKGLGRGGQSVFLEKRKIGVYFTGLDERRGPLDFPSWGEKKNAGAV